MISHSFNGNFEYSWGPPHHFSCLFALCKCFSVNCLVKSFIQIFFGVNRLFCWLTGTLHILRILSFCQIDCRCFLHFPFVFQSSLWYLFQYTTLSFLYKIYEIFLSFLFTFLPSFMKSVSLSLCESQVTTHSKRSSHPSDQRCTPVFSPRHFLFTFFCIKFFNLFVTYSECGVVWGSHFIFSKSFRYLGMLFSEEEWSWNHWAAFTS